MRKSLIVWMLAVVFVVSTVSLAFAQGTAACACRPPVVKDMVAKAKAAIKIVSPADVKAAIDKKEKAIYLDVRDGAEFSAGHLPGAMNVSEGHWNSISLQGSPTRPPRSMCTAKPQAAQPWPPRP